MRYGFPDSDVNNVVNVRGIYPEAAGASLAQRGSSLTPYTSGQAKPQLNYNSAAADGGGMESDAGTSDGGGIVGRPFSWWIILVVLLVGLMYAAQRFGSEAAEFKTIKLSVYNVFVIALAATIGIGFFKMAFGRFQVPGLSDFVAAV